MFEGVPNTYGIFVVTFKQGLGFCLVAFVVSIFEPIFKYWPHVSNIMIQLQNNRVSLILTSSSHQHNHYQDYFFLFQRREFLLLTLFD